MTILAEEILVMPRLGRALRGPRRSIRLANVRGEPAVKLLELARLEKMAARLWGKYQRSRAWQQAYRERNREKLREYAREWRRKNPEAVRAMRVRDRAKYAAHRRATKDAWRRRNIEHVRIYQARKMREWRRAHPQEALAARRRYHARHRDAINARRRVRYAARKAAA